MIGWPGDRGRSRSNSAIAMCLATRVDRGRLLDVGFGHGRLLRAIHEVNPLIELFGLDISPAMVQRAKYNLQGVPVDLRQGTISRTG
jgi:SAM-dependent methyltransferase